MKLYLAIVLTALCLTIIGCETDGPVDVDIDGKADIWGEGGAASHREAVLQCESMHEFAQEGAMSTAEMVNASMNYQECLLTINNLAREFMENVMAEYESHAVGSSLQTFADYRWAAEGLCSTSVSWSDGATGSMAQIVGASCMAQSERALADLIDSFVYFGDIQNQLTIPEDRVAFADCYAAQDVALENASANNEMMMAMHDSADCLIVYIENNVGALVSSTLGNYPEMDALEAEEVIRESLETMSDLNDAMCGLVAEASDAGGGTMANLYQADCRSDAAQLMYQFAGIGATSDADVLTAHLEQGIAPPIHPDLGIYAIYAPGAYAAVYHFDTLAELYAGVPGSEVVTGFGTCMVEQGTPEFDCFEDFTTQGCFQADASGMTPITRQLQNAEEYDLYTPTQEEYDAAAASEFHFQSVVVVTAAYASMYYGMVDGEMYLLAVDLARYSCDA